MSHSRTKDVRVANSPAERLLAPSKCYAAGFGKRLRDALEKAGVSDTRQGGET